MIKWFFHVALMNIKAKEIVDEILTNILDSWLLDLTDELHIWIIWWKIKTNNPKIIIHNFGDDMKQYEYPTLKMLQKECKDNPEMLVYYLHTKWASTPFSDNSKKWRGDMLKCVVNKCKLCIDKLSKYDTVWTKILLECDNYPRHYSGNFWWARASYINTLPPIELREHESRFYAEFWLLWENKNVLYYNIE